MAARSSRRRGRPGPARVDAEYQAELERHGAGGARRGARAAARGRHGRYVVHHARSAPAGLLEVAERARRELIVLGSASAGAHRARRARQRHRPADAQLADPGGAGAARVPVPRPTARVRAGDGGVRRPEATTTSWSRPRQVAERVGATLRLARSRSFDASPIQAGVGREGDEAIVAQWERDVRAALGGRARAGDRPRRELGRGDRGHRVGRRRRARGRLELDRAGRARLPRLARGEDRPALARPGGGRAAGAEAAGAARGRSHAAPAGSNTRAPNGAGRGPPPRPAWATGAASCPTLREAVREWFEAPRRAGCASRCPSLR